MKVDREVVALGTQASAEGEVVEQTTEPARPRRQDDLVQMRVVDDDRSGRGFDDVAEMRVRKPFPKRMDRGGGEDDVANLPQADEEDLDAAIPRSWLRRSASPECHP
jgi:hypothetical protein